jgi:pimeloyl-ACP methyl ester carboxylesterase
MGVDRDQLAARLAPVFGHDLADQPPVVTRQLKAMRDCDVTPELTKLVGIPTLVVSAEHDPIAPPVLGEAVAAGIPGARYVLLPHASHGVPIQAPDQINRLLSDHLAEAEARNEAGKRRA